MKREIKNDWFDIWFEDKQCMIATMIKNMVSDLENGYDYYGKSIVSQRKMIDDYKSKFDSEMEMFKDMEDAKVQRWCYYDLKKRGVIS